MNIEYYICCFAHFQSFNFLNGCFSRCDGYVCKRNFLNQQWFFFESDGIILIYIIWRSELLLSFFFFSSQHVFCDTPNSVKLTFINRNWRKRHLGRENARKEVEMSQGFLLLLMIYKILLSLMDLCCLPFNGNPIQHFPRVKWN